MTKDRRERDQKAILPLPFLDQNLFDPYLGQLQRLFSPAKPAAYHRRAAAFTAALDGQPSRELRRRYTPIDLRRTGTYFTGSELTTRVLAPVAANIHLFERIIDPSCGAGDLLVGAARCLPLKSSLRSTLKLWGRYLVGFDTNSSFVDITRFRLALLAMQRLNVGSSPKVMATLRMLFPYIRVQSGLNEWNLPPARHLILANPPFSHTQSPVNCDWSHGRVSAAAVFTIKCLESMGKDSQLIAILPDVLRTGSRYERWRNGVERSAEISSVEIIGRFDKQTDIDVFVLNAKAPVNSGSTNTWSFPVKSTRTVGQQFEVRVGPVVSFRLNGKGPWRPFVHSSELPVGASISDFVSNIRFQGTVYTPPFVAIRRTSKADYKTRCLATVVKGRTPLAIDNHLIIAIPKDRKVSTCNKLLRVLGDTNTTEWMNARIRCRHMTVSALREIPWLP